ncbi:MAG: polymorphic toxin-type HINT domain-containing protein, partial [Planctomycetaceae bacterium]
AIEPCPPLASGPGRTVTGTFAHAAADVLDLEIEGLDTPLGCTANHPFWSADRHDFVPAGSLTIGEHLRTESGTLRQVTRITPRRGPPVPVFNLEVDAEHVYHVSTAGVLVHNTYPENAPKGPVSIFGRPQVTSPGNAQKIFNMSTDMANSGSYKSVYMHSKWSKIPEGTGVQVSPNRLPDIVGIRLDGKIDMIEIASKTDDLTKLLERNTAIWNQLPAHLRGDIIVIDQLRNWSKVFP